MRIQTAGSVSFTANAEPSSWPTVTGTTPVEAESPTAAQDSSVPAQSRRDELDKVVKKMNDTARIFNHALQFEVAGSNRIVIKVIDTTSGEVIQQIPPERLMEAFDAMDHTLGVLIDHKV